MITPGFNIRVFHGLFPLPPLKRMKSVQSYGSTTQPIPRPLPANATNHPGSRQAGSPASGGGRNSEIGDLAGASRPQDPQFRIFYPPFPKRSGGKGGLG